MASQLALDALGLQVVLRHDGAIARWYPEPALFDRRTHLFSPSLFCPLTQILSSKVHLPPYFLRRSGHWAVVGVELV